MQTKIAKAWKIIAPCWPLENIIACNPLQGLEDLPFEAAVVKGAEYFQQSSMPKSIEAINRETIKWCQAFFDEEQATIKMPYRELGLYQAWKKLAVFDDRLTQSDPKKKAWIRALPDSSEQAIEQCLAQLHISDENSIPLFMLLLTTLPGWASFIKYRTDWAYHSSIYPATQADYLAMRLAMLCLHDIDVDTLRIREEQTFKDVMSSTIEDIKTAEIDYRHSLLKDLQQHINILTSAEMKTPKAQLVFCIDVRSEPFRRVLEQQGDYDTYGFAGFFGIPVTIEDALSGESYASCPVLLKPKHHIKEELICSDQQCKKILRKKHRVTILKKLYESLKYTFTTPFVLVEALGLLSGISMLWKTTVPFKILPSKNKSFFIKLDTEKNMSYQDECSYAEGALKMIGLTRNFAPLVVFCGHGSQTENNAYATALDCGACGGRHGGGNAKILTNILNHASVREYLRTKHIYIPQETTFLAAEHNTTTDEIEFFIEAGEHKTIPSIFKTLQHDIRTARKINTTWRCQQLGDKSDNSDFMERTTKRSLDWAQTRPEWGLARNAAFIVAPRTLTKNTNLEGRAFLHSYDWQQDSDGASLMTILTAPMVVAQWINTQYLFSSLDNIAYGSGSKITHNITGKIGIMQGNGSDLMHGLPLQSVYSTDAQTYHQPLRLLTVVYAPKDFIHDIISQAAVLQKLFGNGWVTLCCIDPHESAAYLLDRKLAWIRHEHIR